MNKKKLESSFARPYITAILGPRRVGKTTFVHHYAQQFPSYRWVFLTMDDMRQRIRVSNQELAALIVENAKQNVGGKDKIWVVIDEAQKCPEVFDQVKTLYDRYKDQDKIKFIITGSAMLSLHQMSAETLAGRIELHHLQEFTLRESTLYREPETPKISLLDLIDGESSLQEIDQVIYTLAPFRTILEEELTSHLLWGGLPEVLSSSQDEKVIYLNNYIQTYLEKDVRAIETITDLHLYKHLMEILAQQTGSVRDDQKIVDALGCSRDTLKKYRGFLAATLIYKDIYPYIDNTMRRIVKSPKGYITNNGLVSVLTGFFQLPLLIASGFIGHRFENWFFNELNVWLERYSGRSEIYFWRLISENEIDFIIDKKPYIYPFEVTYNTKEDPKKLRTLEKFLAIEPKAKWGFYIYRGDFRLDKEKRICFIPAWAIG